MGPIRPACIEKAVALARAAKRDASQSLAHASHFPAAKGLPVFHGVPPSSLAGSCATHGLSHGIATSAAGPVKLKTGSSHLFTALHSIAEPGPSRFPL
jgi:hypothetical protein